MGSAFGKRIFGFVGDLIQTQFWGCSVEGICSQPMTSTKAAAHYETVARGSQVTRQLMEIINSWDDDDDDNFLIHEDVPPIDSTLISEDLFLAQHPGHVYVSITIPTDGAVKSPYVLLPSLLEEIYVESLSETVSCLKDRIAQVIRISPNKQKLISLKSGVMEDHLSLAYYNVGGDDYMLFLSIEDSFARRSLTSNTIETTGFL